MNQMDRLTDETVKNLIRGKKREPRATTERRLKGKLTKLLEECKKVEDISDLIRNVIEEINPDVVEVVSQPSKIEFIDLTDIVNELANAEGEDDIADVIEKLKEIVDTNS